MSAEETKTENNLIGTFKQVKETLENNPIFRVAINGLALAAGIGISFTSLGTGLPILGLVLPGIKKMATENFLSSLKDAAVSLWNNITGNKEEKQKVLENENLEKTKTEDKPDFLTTAASMTVAGVVTGISAIKNVAGYLWNKITGSTKTATQEQQTPKVEELSTTTTKEATLNIENNLPNISKLNVEKLNVENKPQEKRSLGI